MNFNEQNLLKEKTEPLYLRISKLARAKVLLKLEFDTEDQVLFNYIVISKRSDYEALRQNIKLSRQIIKRESENTDPEYL